MPKLSACTRPDRVLMDLQARNKMDAIRELALRLEGPDQVADLKRFLSLVMQREKVETTAVGHGVAIPHAHGDCVRSLAIGLGIAREGIDFGAMDGDPVRILVMIASPARHFQDYLKAVSRVARMFNQEDFRRRILDAQTPEAIVQTFGEIDRSQA